MRTQFPGNIIPQNRINGIAKKVAGYLPDPNVNIAYFLGPNYQNPNASARDDNTLVTAKIDQLFGSNRLAGRYTYTDKDNFGVGYFLNPNTRLYGGHNVALSDTALLSPSMVNEIRGGVQRFHAYRGPALIDPPITQTLGIADISRHGRLAEVSVLATPGRRRTTTASIVIIRRMLRC